MINEKTVKNKFAILGTTTRFRDLILPHPLPLFEPLRAPPGH